jgi:energy-converting hydrogenase Eha subunit A
MISIEQLRKPKIFNMALFDLTATFIGAFIIHLVLWMNPMEMKGKNKRTILQYLISLLVIFVMFLGIAVIFHRIFGIQSALSAYLGFNDMPFFNR